MRTKLLSCIVGLTLLADARQAGAQGERFFRISGPAATTIIAFDPDGTLIWSNAQAGTNYIVQTATHLSDGGNWVDYIQLPVTNHVSTNQIIAFNLPAGTAFIPAGTFKLGNVVGDPDITDANPITVYVSALVADLNLVNYGLWTNVYAYATSHGYKFANAGANGGTGTNYPVETVDWFDCVKWCNARSQQAGLTPVYYTDAVFTQVLTNGDTNTTVYQNVTVNGYRLPTEAEWEKAARAGPIGLRFPWGNTIQTNQAQYVTDPFGLSYDLGPFADNPTSGPSPVGSFQENGYGLHDMAGNMFEWCWDWYGSKYGVPTTTDPTGVASGSARVLRGGGWGSVAVYARCANRYSHDPGITHNCYGFRCVRGF